MQVVGVEAGGARVAVPRRTSAERLSIIQAHVNRVTNLENVEGRLKDPLYEKIRMSVGCFRK